MSKVSGLVHPAQPKSRADFKLVTSIILFSLMVFVRDMGYYSFTPIFFIVAVTIISVVLSYHSLKAFAFFYLTAGLSVHGIALIPLVLALIVKKKQFNANQFFFAIILLLFEFIHLSSYSFSVDFNSYVVYALNIFLFFFLLFDDSTDNETVIQNIKYYVLGVLVATLIIFCHSLLQFGFQNMVFESFRMGTSFEDYDVENEMVTKMNPNQLAFYSLTAFSLLLFVKGVYRSRLMAFIVMAFLVFVGILSASRTWLIIMAIALASFFAFSRLKGKLSFIVIIVALFVAALQFGSFSDAVYTRYNDRFEGATVATAGHRVEIIHEYNQWLASHPQRMVYGTGALYYGNICMIRYSTHNSIQQIIVCYGVLGLFLFLSFCIVFHVRYSKRHKSRIIYYLPFALCFLFSQSGQLLNPVSMMLPFVAATLPLKLTREA